MKNKYSLKKKVEHISVENEDGNGTTEFQIREMTAATRDAYLDRIMKRTKIVGGVASGLSSFEGVHAELLTVCLFAGEAPVTKEQVQSWPSGFVADVFKQAQLVNGLNKMDADASEKNE
jgi:hypothetical protein